MRRALAAMAPSAAPGAAPALSRSKLAALRRRGLALPLDPKGATWRRTVAGDAKAGLGV